MKQIKDIIDRAIISKLNNAGTRPTERAALKKILTDNIYNFFRNDVTNLLFRLANEWCRYGGTVKDMNGKLYNFENFDDSKDYSFVNFTNARISFSLLNVEIKLDFVINNLYDDYTNGYNLQCLVNGRVFSSSTWFTFEDILNKISEETLMILSERFSVENFK